MGLVLDNNNNPDTNIELDYNTPRPFSRSKCLFWRKNK